MDQKIVKLSFYNSLILIIHLAGDTVFECSECESNEKIHLNRDNSDSDANLIPYCSYEQSNFQLYKILGGIIGAIGIICLLVCLIRFLVKQICGNQRINNRTSCGDSGGGSGASTNTNGNTASNRTGRRRNRSPQLQNNHRDDATEYLHNDYSTSVYPVGFGNFCYSLTLKSLNFTSLP
uniref:Uncharacterized protein n=1 Tax=Schistosoma haematobium TaxID=6185 RepID=A0A095A178_SCHHA